MKITVIRNLEQKAFIRGLKRAAAISQEIADDVDRIDPCGAHIVRCAIEDEVKKLTDELDGEQYK